MFNKKIISGAIALCLSASLFAGCTKNNITSEDETKPKKDNTEISISGNDTSVDTTDLKEKYAESTSVEYTTALFNLERDHIFTYDISESFFDNEIDEYGCFTVYYDSELTNRADTTNLADYETMKFTIEPGLVFDYELEGSICDDGTWGTRSKFYLVQYLDLETGEALEKPLVTVFTVKDEISAPTLSQKMGDDGYYTLTWSEVEGADYYEVYEYQPGLDGAFLEYTTTETSGSYEFFETNIWHIERFKETYGGTEIDVNQMWTMNALLDTDAAYFVVAKTDDGKVSAMSNECYVADIANQIPYTYSDDFIEDYSGNNVLALPAYIDMQMVDGSIGKFLIQYQGATVTLVEGGTLYIDATIMNLPIKMPYLTFTGMDFETFMSEAGQLKTRAAELGGKSVTVEENIDIPYVPAVDEVITESTPEEVNVSEELMSTVYANSALSEWIAINLLSHTEEISLADFPECANTDLLSDSFMEAYTQNPLCGIINTLKFDYSKNALLVDYVLNEEETQTMQSESIIKAKEIINSIIDDGMSDFEKEDAINTYLCDNAQYNDAIYDYINDNGTISSGAVENFVHSFTPYGILVENLGVCESYSEAFLLLCHYADIDAIIETGKLSGVNHEWNRVKIDGSWCVMDVTNNDSVNLPNSYFNLSDEMAKSLLIADKDGLIDSCIDTYAAKSNAYEYYKQHNLYKENALDAATLLADILKDNDVAIIRTLSGLKDSEVFAISQEAVNQANVTNALYYYNNGVLSITKK